jgi:hypothetical protein
MTLTLQLFKNSNETREKLRLNFHSLSVRVSEVLEYGRKFQNKTGYTYRTRLKQNYNQKLHYITLLFSSLPIGAFQGLITSSITLTYVTYLA